MTSRRRVLCAVMLSLATLLMFVPAQAATWGHTDPGSDIRRGWTGQPYVRAPEEKFGDIRDWSVRHSLTKVLFTLHARDLRRYAYAEVTVVIKVPRHTYEIISDLNAVDHGSLFDPHRGVLVDCPEFRWRADFKRNAIRAEVPRSCLESPEWVRIGVVFRRGWKDSAGGVHEDFDYGLGRAGSLKVLYGPRVLRG